MTWVHGKEGDDIVFNPPLILVRQRWILETLRKESMTSVLDIGCGEGNLLQALSFPALTIPEPCIQEDTSSSKQDEPEPLSLHLKSPPSSASSSARPITPSCNKEKHRLLRSTLIRATSLIGQGIVFEDIRETVRDLMSCWGRRFILVSELWPELGVPCGGSKRVLVQALGGWGDVPPPPPLPSPPPSSSTSTSVYSYSGGFYDSQEFSIKRAGYDLEIQWDHYHAHDLASSEHSPDGLIDFVSRDNKGKREENGWGSEESIPGWG